MIIVGFNCIRFSDVRMKFVESIINTGFWFLSLSLLLSFCLIGSLLGMWGTRRGIHFPLENNKICYKNKWSFYVLPIEALECLFYYVYKQLLLYHTDIVTLILIIVLLFTIFRVIVLISVLASLMKLTIIMAMCQTLVPGGIVSKNLCYLTLNIKTSLSLQKQLLFIFLRKSLEIISSIPKISQIFFKNIREWLECTPVCQWSYLVVIVLNVCNLHFTIHTLLKKTFSTYNFTIP